MKPFATKNLDKLAAQILKYRETYYAGQPLISDVEYDALENELRRQDPLHPILNTVGALPASPAKKRSHRVPMLSLAKTYEFNDLEAWRSGRPVVGAWKIDGNSLSLVYGEGRFHFAKTRGNGRVGEDVTEKILRIPIIPKDLQDKRSLEVRGELYCTLDNFTFLAAEMQRLGLDKPSNPRNVVAGILGRKEYHELARFFDFYAFDLLFEDEKEVLEMRTEMYKMDYLQKLGFALPAVKLCQTEEEMQAYLQTVKEVIGEQKIAIDGAVFSFDELQLHFSMGATSHHPRYRMSFKWQGETADVEILNIVWNTSRLGIVTPVAVIEPTWLSGAQISNVTLHNAAHVRLHQLKIGDRIEIVRSGEVIPKFLSVVEPAVGEVAFPRQCPSCSSPLSDDGVRLLCLNKKSCPAQKMQSILNWVQTVGIDDLSEKRLSQMIEAGLVQDIPDLYNLSIEKLLTLPLVKEKMAQKLFDHIQKSKNLELAVFLTALGITGAGKASWDLLVDVLEDIGAILNAKVEDIVVIKGFAERSAELIVTSLSQKRPLIDALLKIGVSPQSPEKKAFTAPQTLDGMTFVITGALSRPRKEIEDLIRKAGGKVTGSVSNKTSVLVCESAESTSSKAVKARELGVEVWSEEGLISKLG